LPLGGGIAAALALMATFGLGGGAGSSFDAALDTTPSGRIAALDDGTKLTPVLSFRAGDGRYCREFSLGSGAAGGSGGEDGGGSGSNSGSGGSGSGGSPSMPVACADLRVSPRAPRCDQSGALVPVPA
jgi:hypothetical protein